VPGPPACHGCHGSHRPPPPRQLSSCYCRRCSKYGCCSFCYFLQICLLLLAADAAAAAAAAACCRTTGSCPFRSVLPFRYLVHPGRPGPRERRGHASLLPSCPSSADHHLFKALTSQTCVGDQTRVWTPNDEKTLRTKYWFAFRSVKPIP